MTIRQAEKITGLIIAKHENGDYCGRGDVAGEFWVHASDDKTAAANIVALHYRYISATVMKSQNFRCADCKGIRPLSCHHKILRSHGRIDSAANLIALCTPCHEKRHGR